MTDIEYNSSKLVKYYVNLNLKTEYVIYCNSIKIYKVYQRNFMKSASSSVHKLENNLKL